MELSKNDLVVVPGMGVGRVQALQQVEVAGTTLRAFPIDMGPRQGLFWIPEDRVDDQGLRKPMDAKTAAVLIETVAAQEAPKKRANWRQRQRRYEEVIASNDPSALAAMVGELIAVRDAKRPKKQTLSFSERRLFERAMDLLLGELHAATGKARAVWESRIQAATAAPA